MGDRDEESGAGHKYFDNDPSTGERGGHDVREEAEGQRGTVRGGKAGREEVADGGRGSHRHGGKAHDKVMSLPEAKQLGKVEALRFQV